MISEVDAIVVGSGITGGWAAKELAEAGLRTLLLEAGPPAALLNGSERAHTVQAVLEDEQAIQSQCYACAGPFRDLFVSDAAHPYVSSGLSPFAWIRGRHLGGRSLAWARHCFRLAPLDFHAGPGGVDVQWPLSYEELEPWYDRVEQWIGIAGRRDGLPQVPDSKCLPGFGLNAAEELLRQRIARKFRGERSLIGSRVATLTVPHQGRPVYAPRSHQTHPVEDAAHFSSLSSTLPAALATGRLEIRTNSIVARVSWSSTSGLATGVEVVDRVTKQRTEFKAPVVILAAGAIESTRILLNSPTAQFPDGLANGSGCIGRYLMDHLSGVGASGEMPELRAATFSSGRPATSYVPRFRNLNAQDASFVGGYAFICDAFRPSAAATAVFRENAGITRTSDNDWIVRLWSFGECLPRRENRVQLDRVRCDEWGIPIVDIKFAWSENEQAMARDMATSAAEILDAAGARNIRLFTEPLSPGLAIHEMGTARMGRDPRHSVVNAFGQCHDVPNLFIVDGAIMPTSPCQNPSLTFMALASRAACHAVRELRAGRLRRRPLRAQLAVP